MSVIGIDLGTTSSSVSVIRNGSVQLVNVEKSNRKMPSCVAFAGQERLLGERALAQLKDNPKNTICDVKTLIGLTYEEGMTQKMVRNWPFELEEVAGKLKIVIQYEGTKRSFYPEEITSMILSRLWNNAKKIIGEELKGAVITVPASFNHAQRKATMDAAKIAEIHVLGLINEPTAAALSYRQQITVRQKIETERKVLILHMGGGAFNVSAVVLGKDDIEVKASIGKTNLGGRDFDDQLFNHFALKFSKKEGYDVLNDSKAACKLRLACQTAKKNLSAARNVRIGVKALYKGIDFQSSINWEKFWDLNSNMLTTIAVTINKVLEEAKFKTGEIDDILAIGNSTRLPLITNILKKCCGLDPKKIRQTIKPDEAAVLGTALMAEMLWNEQNSQSAERPDKTMLLILKEVSDVLPYTIIIDVNGMQLDLCSRGFNFSCRQTTNLDRTIDCAKFELKSRELILVINDKSYTWKEEVQSMSEINISCDESGVVKVNFKINGSGLIEIIVDPKVSSIRPDEKCGVPTVEMQHLVEDAKSLHLEDDRKNKLKQSLYELESEVYGMQRQYGCELNEQIEWIQNFSGRSLGDIEEKKKELARLETSLRQDKPGTIEASSRKVKQEDEEEKLVSQMATLFRTLGIMDAVTERQMFPTRAEVESSHRKAQQFNISQEKLNALFKNAIKEIERLQKKHFVETSNLTEQKEVLQKLQIEFDNLQEENLTNASLVMESVNSLSAIPNELKKLQQAHSSMAAALEEFEKKRQKLRDQNSRNVAPLIEDDDTIKVLTKEFQKLDTEERVKGVCSPEEKEGSIQKGSKKASSTDSKAHFPLTKPIAYAKLPSVSHFPEENSSKTALLEEYKKKLKKSEEANSSKTVLLEEYKKKLQKSEEANSSKTVLLEEYKKKLQKSEEKIAQKDVLLDEKQKLEAQSQEKNSKNIALLEEKEASVNALKKKLKELQEEKSVETAFPEEKESSTQKKKEEKSKKTASPEKKESSTKKRKEKDGNPRNAAPFKEKGGKMEGGSTSEEMESSTKKGSKKRKAKTPQTKSSSRGFLF